VLTRRERELLLLIIEGKSNMEIADKMCLGYETIKSYRKNLFQKFDVHSTLELMKKAIEEKLV
jgi:DNA-binding CsgD family transcriptional regulator